MNIYKIIITCTVTFIASLNVSAASFDCAKAKSKVEKTICSDPVLGMLDEQLLIAYKASMTTHPLPDYVKARQKDWIKLNNFCDPSKFKICLTENYKKRIEHLLGTNKLTVYSNSKKFSYDSGDAVAEFWLTNGQWQFSVWGGFFIHRQASIDNGKPTYTGCEFEGKMPNFNDQYSVSNDGAKIKFRRSGDSLTFEENTEICYGFGQLPENFVKISAN